jgi:hypothetical protein
VLRGLGARDRAAVHAERKETRDKADQVVHLRHSFFGQDYQQTKLQLINVMTLNSFIIPQLFRYKSLHMNYSWNSCVMLHQTVAINDHQHQTSENI